jgi:predicted RNase H-like nuclease
LGKLQNESSRSGLTVVIIGIDLAWGERKPDGVAMIEITGQTPTLTEVKLVNGDAHLLDSIDIATRDQPCMIAIDAPLICPNQTGARPVDREMHRLFHRQKAGCYPANLQLCPRPPRLGRLLFDCGFSLHWKINQPCRSAFEVYPHPAMIRFFGLAERLPYKRGPVAQRRLVFQDLQRHLRAALARHFPDLVVPESVIKFLHEPWCKAVEDQTDAIICALIGLWHWQHQGKRSQIAGDADTGFIVLPLVN